MHISRVGSRFQQTPKAHKSNATITYRVPRSPNDTKGFATFINTQVELNYLWQKFRRLFKIKVFITKFIAIRESLWHGRISDALFLNPSYL